MQAALKQLPDVAARGDSSSRTTEASRSPSSPRGSAYRSVRSRAGCSPGSRACASFSTTPHRKDHGNRNSRADRRATRSTRSTPDERRAYEAHLPGCERCQAGARVVLGDDRGARRRGVRARRRAPALRERILADVARGAAAERRPVRAAPAPRSCPCSAAAAAIAAVVALGIGLWASSLSSELDDTRAALERERAAAEVLVDPAARTVSSPGRSKAGSSSTPTGRQFSCSTASIRHLRARRTRCGSFLAETSSSRIRAGLFPGRDGAEIDAAWTASCAAGDVVAVTVEKAGGVDAPTTAPIVASDPV